MRSVNNSIIDMLHYEAKRNPDLAQLVANVEWMSYEEISAAKTKLPWMRKALRQLKDIHEEGGVTNRAMYYIDKYVVDSFSDDPMGEIRRWQGGDTYLKGAREISHLVPAGALLWFPDAGGMWYDSTFCPTLDPKVFTSTVSMERASKSQYAERYRAEINRNHQHDNLPEIGQSDAASPLGRLGVRITRLS